MLLQPWEVESLCMWTVRPWSHRVSGSRATIAPSVVVT